MCGHPLHHSSNTPSMRFSEHYIIGNSRAVRGSERCQLLQLGMLLAIQLGDSHSELLAVLRPLLLQLMADPTASPQERAVVGAHTHTHTHTHTYTHTHTHTCTHTHTHTRDTHTCAHTRAHVHTHTHTHTHNNVLLFAVQAVMVLGVCTFIQGDILVSTSSSSCQ